MDPIVKCIELTKTYRQGDLEVPALRGIDLEIHPSEFLSLSGPSGSGKTTLLNMIGGLDRPTSGSVIVDGQRLETFGKSELADLRLNRVGLVFQAFNLVPVLSSLENVEFIMQLQGMTKAKRQRKALDILGLVGLSGLENRRPAELSGGQQQRVAVARALVTEPSILLADEPTANLDSKNSEELLKLMKTLNRERGTTFIISSHDPMVIRLTERKVRIVDGKVAEDSD